MAAASTVAVVVPSPATSEVLVATSRTICAPMFWKWSARSISFATVTPSLVTVGAPNDFSSTTFRPLGPSVTATASLRIWTPRRIWSRAAWWKLISFAAMEISSGYTGRTRSAGGRGANVDTWPGLSSRLSPGVPWSTYSAPGRSPHARARRPRPAARPGRCGRRQRSSSSRGDGARRRTGEREGDALRAAAQAGSLARRPRHQDLRDEQAGRVTRGGSERRRQERGAVDRRRPQAGQARKDQGDSRSEAVRVRAPPGRDAGRGHAGHRERRQALPQRARPRGRSERVQLRDAGAQPRDPQAAQAARPVADHLRRPSLDARLGRRLADLGVRGDGRGGELHDLRRPRGEVHLAPLARAARREGRAGGGQGGRHGHGGRAVDAALMARLDPAFLVPWVRAELEALGDA